MRSGIWQEFEGYDDIVADIAAARKQGHEYAPDQIDVKSFVERLHPSRLALRITDIITETTSTKTFRLAPVAGILPPFQAGQYLALYLEIDGIRTSRPYSISSPPNQTGYYDVTVRRVADGLVSNFLLDEAQVGMPLASSGPQGGFHFNPLIHMPNIVAIAGGSGITPFMSMIREIADRGLDRTVYLFYGNQTTTDIIFHKELERLSRRFSRIKYFPVIESPPDGFIGAQGYITADLILETCGDVWDKTFFICGPKGLYDFCLPELESLGINRHRVRKEMYGTPVHIWKYPGWPPDIQGDASFKVSIHNGPTFSAPAGQTLLVSLEKNGIVPPSLCRSGACSMCRMKVLAGKVFQPAGVAVRKSDRRHGYVHACVSYPLTDLEIMMP
jgi:ferredoxin-NADP reductase